MVTITVRVMGALGPRPAARLDLGCNVDCYRRRAKTVSLTTSGLSSGPLTWGRM